MTKTRNAYIIRRQSSIHGRGVFARKDIPAGTRIIEYTGEKITKSEAEKRGDSRLSRYRQNPAMAGVFLFDLNKRYDIDGNVPFNTARHINHSCTPNAETEIVRGKIWIIALRDIAQGEEITYNYGYPFEDYEEHPCFCGTNRCVQFILAEEYWPRLKKNLHDRSSPFAKGPPHRSR